MYPVVFGYAVPVYYDWGWWGCGHVCGMAGYAYRGDGGYWSGRRRAMARIRGYDDFLPEWETSDGRIFSRRNLALMHQMMIDIEEEEAIKDEMYDDMVEFARRRRRALSERDTKAFTQEQRNEAARQLLESATSRSSEDDAAELALLAKNIINGLGDGFMRQALKAGRDAPGSSRLSSSQSSQPHEQRQIQHHDPLRSQLSVQPSDYSQAPDPGYGGRHTSSQITVMSARTTTSRSLRGGGGSRDLTPRPLPKTTKITQQDLSYPQLPSATQRSGAGSRDLSHRPPPRQHSPPLQPRAQTSRLTQQDLSYPQPPSLTRDLRARPRDLSHRPPPRQHSPSAYPNAQTTKLTEKALSELEPPSDTQRSGASRAPSRLSEHNVREYGTARFPTGGGGPTQRSSRSQAGGATRRNSHSQAGGAPQRSSNSQAPWDLPGDGGPPPSQQFPSAASHVSRASRAASQMSRASGAASQTSRASGTASQMSRASGAASQMSTSTSKSRASRASTDTKKHYPGR